MEKKFCVGLMSGTSLDGLDIALCSFNKSNNQYLYTAETIEYSEIFINLLNNAKNLNGLELTKFDRQYGKYLGEQVNIFLNKYSTYKIDFIASHGHTVFHNPADSYTLQIGSGAHIYAETMIPTICDFRSVDVALGGQGAPLVPIGDKFLFSQYNGCINLGGFANISLHSDNTIIAYDICATNIVMNELCKEINIKYDDGGNIARKGQMITTLYEELNALKFFNSKPPKSLGREWVEKYVFPIISKYQSHSLEDRLHTFLQHVSTQIIRATNKPDSDKKQTYLVTGGGAYNHFLIELCNNKSINCAFIVPDKLTIEFKEALIFGFLGYLKLNNSVNTLKSVTGAKENSIGGALYGPY
jgi:anhydro-N-acetylmuramic acid kinase